MQMLQPYTCRWWAWTHSDPRTSKARARKGGTAARKCWPTGMVRRQKGNHWREHSDWGCTQSSLIIRRSIGSIDCTDKPNMPPTECVSAHPIRRSCEVIEFLEITLVKGTYSWNKFVPLPDCNEESLSLASIGGWTQTHGNSKRPVSETDSARRNDVEPGSRNHPGMKQSVCIPGYWMWEKSMMDYARTHDRVSFIPTLYGDPCQKTWLLSNSLENGTQYSLGLGPPGRQCRFFQSLSEWHRQGSWQVACSINGDATETWS